MLYSVSYIRYNGFEGTLTTVDQSFKDISSSTVQSFEVTGTTTVKPSELSSKNLHEVPSSNPHLFSSTSFDKATMSITGMNVLCDLLLSINKLLILCLINCKHIYNKYR